MTRQTRHEDRVVVVTGATRGIGAGIARRLGAEGAAVVLCGRSATDGERVADEVAAGPGEATFVRTDVRDPDDVAGLFAGVAERFGRLDGLVNNAAVQSETAADEVSLSEWSRVVETNFRGYFLCAKHARDRMEAGCIVNVSSNHAAQTMPAHFPYNAVKAGVDGMTRAMALDFGPDVRVNTVSPGWVAVERTTGDIDGSRLASLEAQHPVGRIGEPADVAGAVSFLLSGDAAFVTGANLTVDGGRSAVLQDDTLPDYRARGAPRDGGRAGSR